MSVYTKFTQDEILSARKTWIEFLKNPKRKKVQGYLDGRGGARCCLGHACAALKVPKLKTFDTSHGDVYAYQNFENDKFKINEVSSLPDWVAARLGMWTMDGDFYANDSQFDNEETEIIDFSDVLGKSSRNKVNSLISLNDDTRATPQEIGKILETLIMGDKPGPFRAVVNYKK